MSTAEARSIHCTGTGASGLLGRPSGKKETLSLSMLRGPPATPASGRTEHRSVGDDTGLFARWNDVRSIVTARGCAAHGAAPTRKDSDHGRRPDARSVGRIRAVAGAGLLRARSPLSQGQRLEAQGSRVLRAEHEHVHDL